MERGSAGVTNNPENAFDVEVNVMLDYRSDRNWAANDMGIDSGSTNKTVLEKAYFGGRMIDGGTCNFDVELGRKNLSDVFD